MAEVLTKQETIDQIVKVAQKLDKLDLQILLTKLRVKKMRKEGMSPAAKPRKGEKLPSIEEINKWKHESRTNYAGR